jgi:hypothetical protein
MFTVRLKCIGILATVPLVVGPYQISYMICSYLSKWKWFFTKEVTGNGSKINAKMAESV